MDALSPAAAHGGFRPHLGLICGNLTPPLDGRPALLTHREVETIFHEFGHLLHHLLSRVEVRSLAGTNVAWDFVELPSQIMENWCWEREALDLFARHYETGEPIPEELFQKMKRARTFRSANAQMRQLGFAFVDLALHTRLRSRRATATVAYSRAILQQFLAGAAAAGPRHDRRLHAPVRATRWATAPATTPTSGPRCWTPTPSRASGTNGIFSREVGTAFRETILAKGDSEDPASLFRAFMGRDPDPNALLERLGLR